MSMCRSSFFPRCYHICIYICRLCMSRLSWQRRLIIIMPWNIPSCRRITFTQRTAIHRLIADPLRQCTGNQIICTHIAYRDCDMLPRFRTNLQTYILESPIQQILLIKSRRRLHSVNFTHQLPDFHRNITSVVRRQRSISALNCKFIHTLQHILNFNQLPRCKHSSTVSGSYVASHST